MIKQIISFLIIISNFINVTRVEAIDLNKGKILFMNNCIVCHKNGENVIIPEKNLKKEALEENGMNNVEAITYQILNGKNGMPAFSGRLKQNEIDEIATYVLQQALINFKE